MLARLVGCPRIVVHTFLIISVAYFLVVVSSSRYRPLDPSSANQSNETENELTYEHQVTESKHIHSILGVLKKNFFFLFVEIYRMLKNYQK